MRGNSRSRFGAIVGVLAISCCAIACSRPPELTNVRSPDGRWVVDVRQFTRMAPIVPKWAFLVTLSEPRTQRREVLYSSENPPYHSESMIGFAFVAWTEDSNRLAVLVQGVPGGSVRFGRDLRTSAALPDAEVLSLLRSEMRKQYPEIPRHMDPVKDWVDRYEAMAAYRQRVRR